MRWNAMKWNEGWVYIVLSEFLVFTKKSLALVHQANGLCKVFGSNKKMLSKK